MRERTLPPSLISLVHHTELNKAGWWDRSIQQFILAVVWLEGRPLTDREIADRLSTTVRLDVDLSRVCSLTTKLTDSGALLGLPEGAYALSEDTRKALEARAGEAERVASRAKERFCEALSACCPALDGEEEWTSFQDKLLTPLVQDIGAGTYQLISGAGAELERTAKFAEYLSTYKADHRQALRTAIVTFLNPGDPVVRAYVLSYLNAYFCVEAGNLRAETIESLAKIVKHPPSFKIFVDTNFLFSFLELHENPSNEAARALVELTKQLEGSVTCRFYVSSATLDEFKRTVSANAHFLGGLALPPNLAEAALRLDLNGIAQRFVSLSKGAGRPVNAEDYFKPYLTDLKPVLRSRGIEFFNDPMNGYSMRQDVIDDIMAQREYEKRHPARKPKGYEQLEHDVVLWHFVFDKRPARAESPVEATYWIVTIDYHFLGFDAYKRHTSGGQVPICLHPASLIQMLQFWLPRTQQFEEAVLGSLRLPLLFQEFDPATEKLTIRILNTLARFENVSQLPSEVVGNILVNEALRQKLASTPEGQEQVELVKNALIEENEKVQSKLAAASKENARLSATVTEKDQEIDRLRDELSKSRYQPLPQVDTGGQGPPPIEESPEEAPVGPGAVLDAHAAGQQAAYFFMFWFLLLAVLWLASGAGVRLLPSKLGVGAELAAVWSATGMAWVILVDRFGQRNDAVKEHQVFKKLMTFKRETLAALGFVILWQLVELWWNSTWSMIRVLAHKL